MYFFDFFNVVIETSILLLYCSAAFHSSTLSKLRKILIPLLLIGISTSTGILHLPTQANLFIAFAVALTATCTLYEDKLTNKFFIIAIYMVVIFFADILATIIITFFGISYHMSGSDTITFIVGATLSNIIRFWILVYIGKILSRRVTNLSLSHWVFLFLCPILSILSLIIFDIYLMQAESVNSFLVFIPSFCILYINFMVFRFFETFDSQIQLKVLKELTQHQKENYKILEANEKELRGLSHDIKNHIMMIREYLENQHPETALAHLKNIEQTIENISSVVYTSNPALDAAINIGSRKATAEGIRYSVQILGNSKIEIEAADICKLVSNAIDNAIEACMPCDEKYIYIELKISQETLAIHIENTTILEDKHIITFSTKSNPINHGFGMHNMKKVIDKYYGSMHYKSIDGIFYLDLQLKNYMEK